MEKLQNCLSFREHDILIRPVESKFCDHFRLFIYHTTCDEDNLKNRIACNTVGLKEKIGTNRKKISIIMHLLIIDKKVFNQHSWTSKKTINEKDLPCLDKANFLK